MAKSRSSMHKYAQKEINRKSKKNNVQPKSQCILRELKQDANILSNKRIKKTKRITKEREVKQLHYDLVAFPRKKIHEKIKEPVEFSWNMNDDDFFDYIMRDDYGAFFDYSIQRYRYIRDILDDDDFSVSSDESIYD